MQENKYVMWMIIWKEVNEKSLQKYQSLLFVLENVIIKRENSSTGVPYLRNFNFSEKEKNVQYLFSLPQGFTNFPQHI